MTGGSRNRCSRVLVDGEEGREVGKRRAGLPSREEAAAKLEPNDSGVLHAGFGIPDWPSSLPVDRDSVCACMCGQLVPPSGSPEPRLFKCLARLDQQCPLFFVLRTFFPCNSSLARAAPCQLFISSSIDKEPTLRQEQCRTLVATAIMLSISWLLPYLLF